MHFVRSLALVLIASASPGLAQQIIVLDFDDLVGTGPIPPGYGGVRDWGGWEFSDAPDPNLPPTSGATRIRSTAPSQRVELGREMVVATARYHSLDPFHVVLYRAGQPVAITPTFPPSPAPLPPRVFSTDYEGFVDAFELVSVSSDHAIDDLVLATAPPTLGSPFCVPNDVNSTGVFGTLEASGSLIAADNDLTLLASNLPQDAFGFAIVSRTWGTLSPPGAADRLCLTGAIGRLIAPGQIMNSGPSGAFGLDIDLGAVPMPPGGFASTVPGDKWCFQVWYRDVPRSRFTSGVELTFQ